MRNDKKKYTNILIENLKDDYMNCSIALFNYPG
jgi:hypothetical protein